MKTRFKKFAWVDLQNLYMSEYKMTIKSFQFWKFSNNLGIRSESNLSSTVVAPLQNKFLGEENLQQNGRNDKCWWSSGTYRKYIKYAVYIWVKDWIRANMLRRNKGRFIGFSCPIWAETILMTGHSLLIVL